VPSDQSLQLGERQLNSLLGSIVNVLDRDRETDGFFEDVLAPARSSMPNHAWHLAVDQILANSLLGDSI
jgi:hypothetical protein